MTSPPSSNFDLLGHGIYTVPEASRFTDVSTSRIRRWLRGYGYTTDGRAHAMPPVFQGALPVIGDTMALSFRDMVEVRFVDAFLREGVKWPKLRALHARAAERIGSDHPFSTQRFKTDGRTIVLDLSSEIGSDVLEDLATDQQIFGSLVAPFFRGIVFKDGQAAEWWPLGESRTVVLDPQRRFGQPIVSRRGVPTAILARAFKAERSMAAVADWMDVTEAEVADAVDYEHSLAA